MRHCQRAPLYTRPAQRVNRAACSHRAAVPVAWAAAATACAVLPMRASHAPRTARQLRYLLEQSSSTGGIYNNNIGGRLRLARHQSRISKLSQSVIGSACSMMHGDWCDAVVFPVNLLYCYGSRSPACIFNLCNGCNGRNGLWRLREICVMQSRTSKTFERCSLSELRTRTGEQFGDCARFFEIQSRSSKTFEKCSLFAHPKERSPALPPGPYIQESEHLAPRDHISEIQSPNG